MQRCNKIYNHPVYQRNMEIIAKEEQNRRFCLHNLAHAMDVARIGWIMALEGELDIDKELFYTAALLHDAGRYSGMPHNESGARLAQQLMPECGFTPQETETVAAAIRCHRTGTKADLFSEILYAADKKARMCFACAAADECYWDMDIRNHQIEI